MFFDYLSSSPKNFIFKERSNKNGCGILCSVVIIFLIFIVAIIFILKYYSESNYSISYTHFINDKDPPLKYETIWNNTVLFWYSFSIYNEENHSYENYNMKNNFLLYNTYKNDKIPVNSINRIEIQYFDYELLYECKDDKCQKEEELNYHYLNLNFWNEELDYHSTTPIKQRNYLRRIPIRKNQYRKNLL